MVGFYVAPRDASTLDNVIAAIGHQPRGTEILLAGDFNTVLELPDGNKRDKATVAFMVKEGLDYMAEHLFPIKLLWTKGGRTLNMLRCGQEVRSWTDYILWTNRRLL